MNNNAHRYDDIINLQHHQSDKHPHMLPEERAAQFSSFDALTGYKEAISEIAHPAEQKAELDEDSLETLNKRLMIIQHNLNKKPEITVTYFQQESNRQEGRYLEASGVVKKIDPCSRLLLLQDGKEISFSDISRITGRIFDNYE